MMQQVDMEVEIFSRKNIDQLNWQTIHQGDLLKQFYVPLIKEGTSKYVQNSDNNFYLLKFRQNVLPIVEGNTSIEGITYLASFVSQFIDYTKEEVLKNEKYSSVHKQFAKHTFSVVKSLLKMIKADRVIFVNNFFLSTNLYGNVSDFNLKEITFELTKYFPNHSIIFRSVNEKTDANWFEGLKALYYEPIVCRQLYMLDVEKKKYKKKRPYTVDKKFAEANEEYEWYEGVAPLNPIELSAAKDYYKDLYINKYSKLNPLYTDDFIDVSSKSGLLKYYFLCAKADNSISAVQAVSSCNNIITTPFIGYDQTLPKDKGLYRLMNYKLMQQAIELNYTLNMSSGAAEFKRQRGGEPCFEYLMVYSEHLSPLRKLFWKLLKRISEKFIKPSMLKYKV